MLLKPKFGFLDKGSNICDVTTMNLHGTCSIPKVRSRAASIPIEKEKWFKNISRSEAENILLCEGKVRCRLVMFLIS